MEFKLEGSVKVIMDVQTFDSGFKKREIVVTIEDGQYPQDIKFEFLKDDVTALDKFKVGDNVAVMFTIRGNEYQGKFYNNLIGRDIIKKRKKKAKLPELPDVDPDELPF